MNLQMPTNQFEDIVRGTSDFIRNYTTVNPSVYQIHGFMNAMFPLLKRCLDFYVKSECEVNCNGVNSFFQHVSNNFKNDLYSLTLFFKNQKNDDKMEDGEEEGEEEEEEIEIKRCNDTPMGQKISYFREFILPNQIKLKESTPGTKEYVEKLYSRIRTQNDFYIKNGLDILQCNIYLPSLIQALTGKFKCLKGHSIQEVQKITPSGCVLRLHCLCHEGHQRIFHTSPKVDGSTTYLLNDLERKAIHLSFVRPSRIKLCNVIQGKPFNEETSVWKEGVKVFEHIEQQRDFDWDKIRENFVTDTITSIVGAPIRYCNGTHLPMCLQVFIWQFMYLENVYFRCQTDTRYQNRGFSAVEADGFFKEILTKLVLYASAQIKRRNKKRKKCNFTEFTGPSSELERLCMEECFKKMLDWYCTIEGVKIRLLPILIVADRDGKLMKTYLYMFTPLIVQGIVLPCRFKACFAHGKKTFSKAIMQVCDFWTDRAKKDLDFAFRWAPKTKDYDKILDKKGKTIRHQIVLKNTLDHHAGICICEELGLPCEKKTSDWLNLNKPEEKETYNNLLTAYISFGKLLSIFIDKLTTSNIESDNHIISGDMLKYIDYKVTHAGRFFESLLRINFGFLQVMERMKEFNLPLSPFTEYKLRRMQLRKENLSKLKQSSEYRSRQFYLKNRLKRIHKRGNEKETYYANNEEEKMKNLIDFDEIESMKRRKGLKSKKPDGKSLRLFKVDSNFDIIEYMQTKISKGEKVNLFYRCEACLKKATPVETCFYSMDDGLTHMKESHSRMSQDNWKKKIKIYFPRTEYLLYDSLKVDEEANEVCGTSVAVFQDYEFYNKCNGGESCINGISQKVFQLAASGVTDNTNDRVERKFNRFLKIEVIDTIPPESRVLIPVRNYQKIQTSEYTEEKQLFAQYAKWLNQMGPYKNRFFCCFNCIDNTIMKKWYDLENGKDGNYFFEIYLLCGKISCTKLMAELGFDQVHDHDGFQDQEQEKRCCLIIMKRLLALTNRKRTTPDAISYFFQFAYKYKEIVDNQEKDYKKNFSSNLILNLYGKMGYTLKHMKKLNISSLTDIVLKEEEKISKKGKKRKKQKRVKIITPNKRHRLNKKKKISK